MKDIRRRNAWSLASLLCGPLLLAAIAPGAAETPTHPHPVVAWPAGPFEVRVAFDGPLDPSVIQTAVGRLIPFEEERSVIQQAKAKTRPSRLESSAAHRGALRIVAARLIDNGRTLVLTTDPHPRVATYALHLTDIRSPGQPSPGESIDLLYGLGGVEAAWDDGRAESRPAWSGWWADLDPGIVRRLTIGSVEHERALALLARPGRLVLHTLFVLPKGRFILRVAANSPIQAAIAGENVTAVKQPDGGQRIDYHVNSHGEPFDLSVTLRTGTGQRTATLRASYLKEEEDARDVRLDHARLLVPWAATTPTTPEELPSLPPTMAGGDPARGRSIFYGEQAKCSACHAIGGKGGTIGPDLAHQFERPPAAVYRDITNPGAWIDPNYVAYTVALKDGRTLVGIVRAEGADAIRVTDRDAKSTVVRRTAIAEFRPTSTSIMPDGVAGTLSQGPLRDLLAFLTHPPS